MKGSIFINMDISITSWTFLKNTRIGKAFDIEQNKMCLKMYYTNTDITFRPSMKIINTHLISISKLPKLAWLNLKNTNNMQINKIKCKHKISFLLIYEI